MTEQKSACSRVYELLGQHSAEEVVKRIELHEALVDAVAELLPYAEKEINRLKERMVGSLYPRLLDAELDRAAATLERAKGEKK